MSWLPIWILNRWPAGLLGTALLAASACANSLGNGAGPPDAAQDGRAGAGSDASGAGGEARDAALPAPGVDLGPGCDVPSEPGALLAFLRSGGYRGYARESAPHGSTGPHGGRVLTYVNELLARSLDAGNREHPRCSASVKELFLGRAEVSGWAVFVKTKATSEAGQGFYWLETTSTEVDDRPAFQGFGLGLCVGCHALGRDHFRAPWPLQ